MTNIRYPVTYYDDLEIKMDYVNISEKKEFHLTEDTPLFKVIIHNRGKIRRFGKIALIWKLKELKNERIINIDIPSNDTYEHMLGKEWLYTEGMARYDLIILKEPPENYNLISNEDLIIKLKDNYKDISDGVHPLLSYYIKDRGIYAYEKDRHDKQLKLDHSLNIYTKVITIATILLLLKEYFQYLKQLEYLIPLFTFLLLILAIMLLAMIYRKLQIK